MRCCWALVLTLCSWSGSARGEPLTLHGAVALALRQNPELAAAGADLAAAAGAELAARGLDDPVLSARSTVRLQRAALVAPADEASAALALAQPLPTGGRVALELDTGYARGERAAGAEPAQLPAASQSRHALQLTLQQPLLRGSGAAVARAEQRRAGIGRELASAERAGVLSALLREVVSGYWRLAHAQRELDIRRASAAAARQQLERVHANIAVGKLPPSASAEIEVVIALRDDAVLRAEQARSERDLALRRLCGLSGGELQLAEPLPAVALEPRAPRSFGATLGAALAHSPELLAARARGRAAAVELELREDGLSPRLDLSLAGGLVGRAATARTAYEQVVGLDGYAAVASLALELPLVRRAARGALQLARGRSGRAQLDEASVVAQLRVTVATALGLLETAQRRAALLVPSQRAAALDLEAEQARFEVGRASSFDVLRRQDALAAVQLLLLAAELQRLEADASLAALTGESLARHSSSLGPGAR